MLVQQPEEASPCVECSLDPGADCIGGKVRCGQGEELLAPAAATSVLSKEPASLGVFDDHSTSREKDCALRGSDGTATGRTEKADLAPVGPLSDESACGALNHEHICAAVEHSVDAVLLSARMLLVPAHRLIHVELAELLPAQFPLALTAE